MTDERPALTTWRAILYGAGVVGAIDFAYATIFVVAKGRPWTRPWQTVASAVLGPASFDGGTATVLLGIALHFTVATCIVSVYMIISRWLPIMRQKTLVCGLVFGAIAFFVMNLVVLPLTRLGYHPIVWTPFAIGGLLVHTLLIGPATAYFAGRTVR